MGNSGEELIDKAVNDGHTIVKGDKRTIRGWVMYDWANSVYNLVISSAIFPIFYDNITTTQFKVKYYADKFPGIPRE